MPWLVPAWCAVWLTASRADAQTLIQARVKTDMPMSLARNLEQRGFDVVQGTTTTTSVDVIGSAAELAVLASAGLALEPIQRGHPLLALPPLGSPFVASDLMPPTYVNYESVVQTMTAMADSHPDICRLVDITSAYQAPATFENRHIYGVKISDRVDEDEDEPAILLVAAHHAREIGTVVLALSAVARFLDGYGTDAGITAAVEDGQIWVVPVWNPDGYDYVFSTDNLWRKNRRPVNGSVGVDLNRNYAFGWDAVCSGSPDPSLEQYKGPSAGSEAETQTMVRFIASERFAKVLDIHSPGRQVLHGYSCLFDALASFHQAEAVALSETAGYAGAVRLPSGEGEHEEFEFAATGAYAFLIEIQTESQPTYDVSLAEAAQVWPAVMRWAERPISVAGHVFDACTGLALTSDVVISGLAHANGERNGSGGRFGRFHVFLPPGTYDLVFSADGYLANTLSVDVSSSASSQVDVVLTPTAGCETADHAGFGGEIGGGGCTCGMAGRRSNSFGLALLLGILAARRARRRGPSSPRLRRPATLGPDGLLPAGPQGR